MYAVVGIWTMDDARRDEQSHLLHAEIIPLVKSQPGFVTRPFVMGGSAGNTPE